ncbi:hypothetical protein LDK18_09780 [Fusobacterium nucleatum subsp. nucleatum ATCC 23726]|uniref:Lipoprotein n=1 Tax=Fusobacterium nucleatum subsp. nucleatum (strain ATCC 23726 / VPI 4351) TaxID=525283 RepID=D5RCW7_FUSN2|nr:hypothetical protein [Fusobacterium nucleatum]AVQ22577.1 hypothetical protein C4N14_02290 [Fusobacterium nucleatum subsp. nucleatum ATCC 23726]EFG95301.1 hypothetical protein HMPREF0397_1052 [Fusobacterium nucleatum subsp. nucleatum ATCC 23726]
MMKRMIILIIMGLTLSSCQLFTEAIKDNINRVGMERERKEARKKDAYAAVGNPEYETGVELAIQDIKKRPVNKKVEFGETTLLIPENTRLNPKHGNIVDEKTGYGIAILFEIKDYCTKVFYRKKVRNDKYILLYYNNEDKNLNVIGQKIIKANSLTNTCK